MQLLDVNAPLLAAVVVLAGAQRSGVSRVVSNAEGKLKLGVPPRHRLRALGAIAIGLDHSDAALSNYRYVFSWLYNLKSV